jgi:nitrite reductase/ring-hydroxylating ferredoxin subunit/uncharacterized membrane protein
MRSRASYKGHPLHPALIPFPLAFLTGAFVFDALGRLVDRHSWWATGGHLAEAGLVLGLLAALPGLVDYFATVPPQSSARVRARKHALLNATALALFFAARLVRGSSDVRPELPALAIELAGAALLVVGSWHGGVLVNRNLIGVDVRQAHAGKWREARVASAKGEPVVVARADELRPSQMKLLHVDGRRIVLGRTEAGWVAFEDRCTHRGGSLAGGTLACGIVQCLWHGSQFDVATGEVRAGPAREPIATYRVEERDGRVLLAL